MGYQIVGAPGAKDYPTIGVVAHDNAKILNGNLLTLFANGGHGYIIAANQNPAAQNDEFSQIILLESGTYDFFTMGIRSANRGIIEWRFDGVLIDTQDWYGSGTPNFYKTKVGIIVATSGKHTLNGKITSKNGSSADYFMYLTRYGFKNKT